MARMKLKQRIIVVLTALCTLTGVLLLMESGVKPISAIYERVSPGQLDFRTRDGDIELQGGGLHNIGPRDQPAWAAANGMLRHQLGKSASKSGGSPQQNYTGGGAGGAAPGGQVDQVAYSDKLPRSSGANDLNNFTKSRTNNNPIHRPPGFPIEPNFYNIRRHQVVTQPPNPPQTFGKLEALFTDFPVSYQVPEKASTLLRPKKPG